MTAPPAPERHELRIKIGRGNIAAARHEILTTIYGSRVGGDVEVLYIPDSQIALDDVKTIMLRVGCAWEWDDFEDVRPDDA